ncbi:MAG: succinate dehydrogenase/fumarate reductase cytochrome b subunit [Candidatus Azobacteroides sp.]|nr:succinate dehydrogenase/fumarate reductase cytochrome b subunit [Candidatus Azobacteroides sp.]
MYWLFNSSIGRKFIMSISGIFLVLFLLFHLSMNLTLLFSTDAYDLICEFLGANWYAIVGTLVLAGGVIIHIGYGTWLTLLNKKARGAERYASSNKTKTEWAAKNMWVLGFIIFLGLVIHFWNFWFNMQFAELIHSPNAVTQGSELVIALFSQPLFVVIYLVWLVALWFHLTHGVWSAFQTLGWNGKLWFSRLQVIANIVATVVMIGFAAVPLFFLITK